MLLHCFVVQGGLIMARVLRLTKVLAVQLPLLVPVRSSLQVGILDRYLRLRAANVLRVIAAPPVDPLYDGVCAGGDNLSDSEVSGVHMVGGFLLELLTSSLLLPTDRESAVHVGWGVHRTSASADRVPFPKILHRLPCLLGKRVLEVTEEDGEPILWLVRMEVRVDGSPAGSASRRHETLLVECVAADPWARPEAPVPVGYLVATGTEAGVGRVTGINLEADGSGSGSDNDCVGVSMFLSTCESYPVALCCVCGRGGGGLWRWGEVLTNLMCTVQTSASSCACLMYLAPASPSFLSPSSCKSNHPGHKQLHDHCWG